MLNSMFAVGFSMDLNSHQLMHPSRYFNVPTVPFPQAFGKQ